MDLHFTNLLVVVAIAFAAPLVLGFAPALRFPAVVLEIVAGIAVGPAVLGWVHVDEPVQVMSIVGLAFLLFLAGLEIEVQKLRGTALRLASAGFAVSFAIALVIGAALGAAGVAKSPLFLAIVLSA
ncbi:MAG: cation:proton antiporter, partial [Thermoleophilaceae bacterium]